MPHVSRRVRVPRVGPPIAWGDGSGRTVARIVPRPGMAAGVSRAGGRAAWLGAVLTACMPAASAVGAPAPEPPVALVLGESAYAGRPALPACAAAVPLVAAALREAGFAVTTRLDGSNGEVAGAIATLAARVAGPPAVPGLLYACGVVMEREGRPFLLPAAARPATGADLLTQGVLVASLRRTLAAAGAPAGLLLLDAVRPAPGEAGAGDAASGGAALGLPALLGAPAAAGLGVVAVVQGPGPEAALARALAEVLPGRTGEGLEVGALAAALRGAVERVPGALFLQQLPPGPAPLVPVAGPATPPAAPVAAPPAATPSVAVPAPAARGTTATPGRDAAAPQPSSPAPSGAAPEVAATGLPEEGRMTPAQRRAAQQALGRLGYYDGVADGVFGPDTRAAVRRLQHELGEPMTGRLTAAQAGHLSTTR